MKPYKHQIVGACFLANRRFGVLADEPRVGKTGTAIMACDMVLAERVLVVTTASGRAVWRKGFADWQTFQRPVQILASGKDRLNPKTRVAVIGWGATINPGLRQHLLQTEWDVLILDESHNAKNFDAKRTQAVFGVPDGDGLDTRAALGGAAKRVWCLTGTPMPNSPLDLFPVLRFGDPDRLGGFLSQNAFMNQFCQWRPKRLSAWRTVPVIMGGKNLDDLKARLDGLFLRRTQGDVGILPPVFETLPLMVPDAARRKAEAQADLAEVLAAIDSNDTKALDMHLGPLRRLTGALVAPAVAELVRDEFDGGLDRVVLAYWHRDVGDMLAEALSDLGVARIDGATPDGERAAATAAFAAPGGPRVFLAQILAAGEAIDLSAAAELIFVEMSFTPKDGKQMALRVTNHGQKRQPRVRVAAMAGSIHEAIQAALLRKVATIKEVMS